MSEYLLADLSLVQEADDILVDKMLLTAVEIDFKRQKSLYYTNICCTPTEILKIQNLETQTGLFQSNLKVLE